MKNFFYFNSSHRNGIVFLSIVVILMSFFKDVWRKHTPISYDFSAYKEEVNRLREEDKKQKYNYKIKKVVTQNKPLIYNRLTSVEVNLADTTSFKSLTSIGTVFANRICKYRHLLGGFYSIDQLKEVYGMDSLRYVTIKSHLIIDANQIKKININFSEAKDLRRHPYISYKMANLIVSYKQQHGVYKTLTDLLNLHLIDSLKFRKIAPYLTTDENESVSRIH